MGLPRKSGHRCMGLLWLALTACDDDGTGTVVGARPAPEGSESLTIHDIVYTRRDAPAVMLLRPDGRVVTLALEACGGEYISYQLREISLPRPIVYHLFDPVARRLDLSVPEVILDVTEADSLTAYVVIRGPSGSAELATTVTDAIGIAQHMGARIMATPGMLALHTLRPSPKAGARSPCCDSWGQSMGRSASSPKSTLRPAQDDVDAVVEMAVLGVFGSPFGSVSLVLLDLADTTVLVMSLAYCSGAAIYDASRNPEATDLFVHAALARLVAGGAGEVSYVRVTSVQDGAFIAAIGVSQAGVIETVDARPSDAIALALRAGSPIQVVQGVLDGYGEDAELYREVIDEIRASGN